ncbi:MAG: alpha-1,2-fucosyltransferase [Cytophagia bacterium]|jgi:hypothetical protein|nr:alpha-1,2-fucosyltransferase [Cytophagia bacterium]
MLAFNKLGQLGRLGNQMFQYASLRGIAARRGYDFGIPPSSFSNEWTEHQLFDVFDLPHLPKQNITYLDRGHAPEAAEKFFHFDELLFNQCPNDISLIGFFQSEKYFSHIKESIKEDFTFKDEILEPCKEMISGLDNPVSLHVRRTDYLTNSVNHYNLQLDYYEKALTHFDDKTTVVVFSDDPKWCMEQKIFNSDRFMISENEDNKIDLCLMTLCSGHIIANSSFSWWGAWLANSKKVVSPINWFGPNNASKDTKDLIPSSWIRI